MTPLNTSSRYQLTEQQTARTGGGIPASDPTLRVLRPRSPLVHISSEVEDASAAALELAGWLAESGWQRPFIVHSNHGASLIGVIRGSVGSCVPPSGAAEAWVKSLATVARGHMPDSIVAVGGGRCLDIAKLAAHLIEVPLIVVPTQLSHDGICSPVAVIPNAEGATMSLPAAPPAGVFFSLPTLRRSPGRAIRAGIGDILSNPLALRDWELAAAGGHEEIDEDAWHLSMESVDMLEPRLLRFDDETVHHPRFLGLLAHALANSGMAMMRAGSSRPASGAEHKISHAIDILLGGRALHGEQVAFASIISMALHQMDPRPLVRRLARLGLPHHPTHLQLTFDETVNVVVGASVTRPGRFTILEKVDPDRHAVAKVLRRLWGDW